MSRNCSFSVNSQLERQKVSNNSQEFLFMHFLHFVSLINFREVFVSLTYGQIERIIKMNIFNTSTRHLENMVQYQHNWGPFFNYLKIT